MKVCKRCNTEKDDAEFGIATSRYKENVYKFLKSNCKQCERELRKIRYDNKKDVPEFKEKNRERAKQYRDKNFDAVSNRRKTAEYLLKHNAWEKKRYNKYKDFINERQRIKRQTPEYKAYVKAYRLRRKDIIFEQEKITKERYSAKHRDNVTEQYCFRLLKTQGVEINDKTLTEKQIKVLMDRVMKRLAELEKGTYKICVMCNNKKSVKYFKRGKNFQRINTCSQCNYKIKKKTKI